MPLRRTSLGGLVFLCLATLAPAGIGVAATPGGGAVGGKVGGTGSIVPRGGIVLVAGVPGFTIQRIFVHAGEAVKQGAPLFELLSVTLPHELANAARDVATVEKDANYRTAIAALTLRLAETRLQRAKRNAANYRAVGAGGTSERESSRLQEAVEEGQANLEIEKLRAQQLQFDLAMAAQTAASKRDAVAANAGRFLVRAPADGTVLKIDHRVGEYVGGDPIVEFGDLSAMYVDAQIYQGDMVKVQTGMAVTVKNAAFPDLATGKVEAVGPLIGTRSQLGDVRIRLDRNAPADRLVGMEVEVVIGP